MKTFYINPATNDLDFDGQHNLKMVDGDDELLQSVQMIMRTNLGEWFLNPDSGFDRFAVLGKQINIEIVTDAIYRAILQEPRISRVENVNFEIVDKVKRKAKVSFILIKDDGGILEGSVSV